jgi:gamma-glutamyltranspeptidase / glutathione hydrolase
VLLGVLGQHQNLATIMAEPPLLQNFDISGVDKVMSQQPVSIPQGTYPPDFSARLKALGLNIIEIPAATAGGLRGTLAAVAIDPKTGKRTAANQPNIMVFNAAE